MGVESEQWHPEGLIGPVDKSIFNYVTQLIKDFEQFEETSTRPPKAPPRK